MLWGYSSAGRAPALQAGGQRFDPAILHCNGNVADCSLKTEYYHNIPHFYFLRDRNVNKPILPSVKTEKERVLKLFASYNLTGG